MRPTHKAYAQVEVQRLLAVGRPAVVDREWESQCRMMMARIANEGMRMVWPTLRVTERSESTRDVLVLRADVLTQAKAQAKEGT